MSARILVAVALFLILPCGTLTVDGTEPTPDHPPRVLLKTDLGELFISLDWINAPENCATFVHYVRMGIYAGTSFDGIDEQCLYGGRPPHPPAGIASNGNMICTAGPPGEFRLPHRRGAVGFRRTAGSCNPDKRSNCTQIYIMLIDHPEADGEFSVFGTLEAEPPVVEEIEAKVRAHIPVPYQMELRDR